MLSQHHTGGPVIIVLRLYAIHCLLTLLPIPLYIRSSTIIALVER